MDMTLLEVRPQAGRNDVVTLLDVYGLHFPQDAQVYLGSMALTTTYIDTTHLTALVPAGMATGPYDVSVAGDGAQGSLVRAYTVQPAAVDVDDLYAEPYRLWSNPVSPYQGETIFLGLVVNRLGGADSVPIVPVRFFLESVAPENAIGDGYLVAIAANASRTTSALEWGIQTPGVYTIWAQIDPDNIVAESDETNNLVRRRITVLQRTEDTTPPVVESISINDGASITDSRTLTLTTIAHDSSAGAGVDKVLYVELLWNVGAQAWVPVQWTAWFPYGQPHSWRLHPSEGLRYIQVWAADRAGNISIMPAQASINYIPSTGSVAARAIHLYRQEVEAGQCLSVQVIPLTGDPELYVWPPTSQVRATYWHSTNDAGQIDAVQIVAPQTGVYLIEVEGFTDATYQMQIEISVSCTPRETSLKRIGSGKTLRTLPSMAVEQTPPDKLAIQETALASLRSTAIYLPLLSSQAISAVAGPKWVYLPLISQEMYRDRLPDLIVESLAASTDAMTVTLRNVGEAPVTDAFWVDVYVNPEQTLTVNRPWHTIAGNGAVWGVTQSIAPGAALTLTLGDPFYSTFYSGKDPFPVGGVVYALADSVDFSHVYGAVLESSEENNLFGPVQVTPGGPTIVIPTASGVGLHPMLPAR